VADGTDLLLVMESSTPRISAWSQRQAMDWSLVLVSQNIETEIVHLPGAGGWSLVVSEQDFHRALDAIRLYRVENRRWGWRQNLLKPGLVFDWASLFWVVLISFFFWVDSLYPSLRSAGIMDGAKVAQGQWWRLFTAMWLHGDLAHLAGNATLGLVLLGLTLGSYGAGVGLLAACLAGAGGNIAVGLLSPGPSSLGSSGLVMGCLGLLATDSLIPRPRGPQKAKQILTGVLGGVMLFVLLGLNPGSDIRAHFGGFVSGAILGLVLNLVSSPKHLPTKNLGSALIFITLVLGPWWAALRSLR
jgi:rhomboid protease GluP